MNTVHRVRLATIQDNPWRPAAILATTESERPSERQLPLLTPHPTDEGNYQVEVEHTAVEQARGNENDAITADVTNLSDAQMATLALYEREVSAT